MAMATQDIKDGRRNYFLNLDTQIVYKIISDHPIGRDSGNIPVYKVTYAAISEMFLSSEILSMKKLNPRDRNSTLYQELFARNDGLPFHKNLMRVHAHFVDSGTEDLCAVIPFAERGSLRSIMADTFPYGFQEACISVALRCVLKALCFLHRSKTLHRDINAGHVYVKNGPHIMLGFAASIYEHGNFNAECSSHSELPATQISIWGGPPENHYTEKGDIWRVGIMALELAYGGIRVPNREALEMMIREIVETKKLPKKQIMEESGSEEMERSFSREFGKMVAECLTWHPGDRPTAFALLKHKFFSKNGLKRAVFKKNFQDVVIKETDETDDNMQSSPLATKKKPKSCISIPGAESFDGVMDLNFTKFYPTCPNVDLSLPNSCYEAIDAVPLTWSFKKPKRKLFDENSEEAGREIKVERREDNVEDVKNEGDEGEDDNREYSSPSTPSTPPTPPSPPANN